MNANQRRPGFRLPWASETDELGMESPPAAPPSDSSSPAAVPRTETPAASATTPPAPATKPAADTEPAAEADTPAPEAPAAEAEEPTAEEPKGLGSAPDAEAPAEEAPAAEAPVAPSAPADDDGDDFMRDLVSAMRRVAEEARESGMSELRARADEHVRLLETDAERRREDLRARAEADVDAVGEWAKGEAERITREAEQRAVARRGQLEQQLAGDTHRTEAETRALRDRVSEYERELAAYHGQLSEIKDPAAFAAAAKRMPRAPELAPPATPPPAPASAADAAPAGPDDAPVEPSTAGSNGVPTQAADVHPAEEEVLAARLAQLDATLPSAGTAGTAVSTEPTTTEVVVKGLGSFGAITGFRQALSAVAGISGVALSLGQTGEFVFRATHAAGFDVRAAIAELEGEAAAIEDRPEGGLRVTLERAR